MSHFTQAVLGYMSLNSVIEQEGCRHKAIFKDNINICKKKQMDAMIFFPLIGSWTQTKRQKGTDPNKFLQTTPENTAASQLH